MSGTAHHQHPFALLVWRCLLAAVGTGTLTATLLMAGVLLIAS